MFFFLRPIILSIGWQMCTRHLYQPWKELSFLPWPFQFSRSCPTLCDPMDCSTPGFPVHHQLLEFAQTHVHRISDAIQPSHALSSPSPSAFSFSQYQHKHTHTHTHTPFRSRKTMNRRKMNFFGKILNMHFFENCYKIDPLSNKLKIILIAR